MRTYQDKALEYASIKHEKQLDDDGRPYFFAHIIQVYDILNEVTSDDTLLSAGILHDVIEDTPTKYEEVLHEFNKDIADLVMEVTYEKNKDDTHYYPRLESRHAVMLKFADRLSRIARMEEWPEEKQTSYLERSRFWPIEPRRKP